MSSYQKFGDTKNGRCVDSGVVLGLSVCSEATREARGEAGGGGWVKGLGCPPSHLPSES